MLQRPQSISLKNKFFFTTLAVVLILSISIALLARWVLVGSLDQELTTRGVAIAQSIADQSKSHVLTRDHNKLVGTIFDAAQLGERQHLVEYIFILDQNQEVLSHTFIRPFPDELRRSNPIQEDQEYSVRRLDVVDFRVYDIAVPILEGIYQIGTVRLGIKEKHIEQIVHKMRITFLGFIVGIVIITFALSHRISLYITRPLNRLTDMADQISQGNLDIKSLTGTDFQEENQCPAISRSEVPCWHVDRLMNAGLDREPLPEKPDYCTDCLVSGKKYGDEVQQLSDSFNQMVKSIKLYRKRVLESESKYRSLFESGPVPVFVLDFKTLQILDANPSAEKVYGYQREELVNMDFTRLAPEFRQKLSAQLQAKKRPGSFMYTKAAHHPRDEHVLYVNVEARLSTYRTREAIIVATTDITEMVEKDAQLIQASKMTSLGQLSAGVAHELNQPLNAIKMGSDFIQMMYDNKQEIPQEQLVEISREINSQVDRATEIINNLREFGRKSDPSLEKTDINECVHKVLSIMGQQLKLNNINVKLNLSPEQALIMAHKNRLDQVIFNLVSNARDAVIQKQQEQPKDWSGEIAVSTSLHQGRVLFSVRDNGTGMPRFIIDKIFDPFFTTKEAGKGMGLGLSISYGIIRDYGGEIEIQSEENQGTSFEIVFPRAGEGPERLPNHP